MLQELGASAIILGTAAVPGIAGRNLAEGYVTQPMAMARATVAGGRIQAGATLNLEGLTLRRGELNAGMYGEGYVDRRHPHTWLHEAVVTAFAGGRSPRFSVTVGKGFVPFGTDDPMSRPFVKYPVNHHLAQLLERAGVFAAAAAGPLIAELATFNGDEPDSPSDWPDWDRVGDSWSTRVTVTTSVLELQGSLAAVESPEITLGGGLDQRKWSASARHERGGRYALIEWAKTSERDRGKTAFAFSSFLAEAAIPVERIRVAVRAERTERPEEERLLDAFRSPRPHTDLNILGRTRWNVLSAAVSTERRRGRALFAPFVEISTQMPTVIDKPSVFDPAGFYGSSQLWSFSAGFRVGYGMTHRRMGRYGAAVPEQAAPHSH